MVRLRFKRVGRHGLQLFRLVATDSRSPRDGKVLETLGTFNPNIARNEEKFTFQEDRVRHWISKGAQPSHRVWIQLRKKGINKANALAKA